MSIAIRKMRESDAEEVATLVTELGYPNDAEAIRTRFRMIAESDLLLVAVDADGKAIGFIGAKCSYTIEAPPRVHIVGLSVSSQARRSGVGRQLIREVERWAASIGVERVIVRSNVQRDAAHEFYPAMGYARIKTQAVYEKILRTE